MAGLSDADLSLPWLSQPDRHASRADRRLVLRVSFAGELGWEIHADNAKTLPAIYDAVTGRREPNPSACTR